MPTFGRRIATPLTTARPAHVPTSAERKAWTGEALIRPTTYVVAPRTPLIHFALMGAISGLGIVSAFVGLN